MASGSGRSSGQDGVVLHHGRGVWKEGELVMSKPTINEMMNITLSNYGHACRMWGVAIANKDHSARRRRAKEATRHQTMMHHLISMIETAPNLGEDTTALLPPVGVEARSAMGDLQQEETDDTMDHEEVESD